MVADDVVGFSIEPYMSESTFAYRLTVALGRVEQCGKPPPSLGCEDEPGGDGSMTYLKDSRGAALPLTLVVILVLAILGVSLLTVASSSHSMQASQHRRLAARHIAEGGAETVYQAIKTSSSSVVRSSFTVNLGTSPGTPLPLLRWRNSRMTPC